eukprot:jgi/Astpho2/4208/fgenesh1_pm.00064_%23_11_t
MAKFDEADPRWLVQERADGTNVHGWHWEERDVMPWAQSRLKELLGSLPLSDGAGNMHISTTGVDSVEGFVLINRRKQKLIPTYELHVKGSWKGEVKDGSGESIGSASGSWELPYVADENADEDPELRVAPSKEGQAETRLKQAFLGASKQDIYECFTNPGRIQAYTQAPAKAEPRPGGQLSLFDGTVQGKFEELEPAKRLVLQWRFRNWPKDAWSKVCITLEEPSPGNTIMHLKHTGIPHEDEYGNADVEATTRNGWHQMILRRIKMVFGYGM